MIRQIVLLTYGIQSPPDIPVELFSKNVSFSDYTDEKGVYHIRLIRDIPIDCELVKQDRYFVISGVHRYFKWGLDISDDIQACMKGSEFYDINVYLIIDGKTYKYSTNKLLEEYHDEIPGDVLFNNKGEN